MRVLVCGGRGFSDRSGLFRTLDALHAERDFQMLVYGCADGADELARQWALARYIPHIGFPANWAKHGRRAGPIRNRQMLRSGKPHLVVAFPGGVGTQSMISIAKSDGVDVVDLTYSQE